jgi:membrane-associated protein
MATATRTAQRAKPAATRGKPAGTRGKAARKPAGRRTPASTSRDVPGWVGPVLLWFALARAVLGIVAIPLAPALYRRHFALLVLLRPTKEVLLAGGFLVRRHDVSLPVLLLAAVPLLLAGVWHFYALGRIYGTGNAASKLPRWARHLLPQKRIDALCKVLAKRGVPVIVIGRLAAMPSTGVAAAAGASELPLRRFLVADTAGGLLSFVEAVGAGWVLGAAYEDAGPWLTAGGVAALLVVSLLVGRWLRRV